jgi:hypothetical protein
VNFVFQVGGVGLYICRFFLVPNGIPAGNAKEKKEGQYVGSLWHGLAFFACNKVTKKNAMRS